MLFPLSSGLFSDIFFSIFWRGYRKIYYSSLYYAICKMRNMIYAIVYVGEC